MMQAAYCIQVVKSAFLSIILSVCRFFLHTEDGKKAAHKNLEMLTKGTMYNVNVQ
jgi:hypothetical protein